MQRWCLTKYELLCTLNFQLSVNTVFDLFFDQLSQQDKEHHIHWVKCWWLCAYQIACEDPLVSCSCSESGSGTESSFCNCVWLKCWEFSVSFLSSWLWTCPQELAWTRECVTGLLKSQQYCLHKEAAWFFWCCEEEGRDQSCFDENST